MKDRIFILQIVLLVGLGMCLTACTGSSPDEKKIPTDTVKQPDTTLVPAAYRTEVYFPKLRGKKLGLVINHTARVGEVLLMDTLLRAGLQVEKVFTPEHGFTGNYAAGEHVENSDLDSIPVVSLYGDAKMPAKADLEGLDLLVFDIQDVGARFYTYISTLHYVMQACASYDVPLLVLDRPNPNGWYVDGPVLDTSSCQSFVGMHPIPVVHGLTIGELAGMINGEGWHHPSKTCKLEVVRVKNYHHGRRYELPVPPSPNLPNARAVALYPALCFFEATPVSIGRGTPFPFQVIGYPDPGFGTFRFTPRPIPGKAPRPKQNGKICYGIDLRPDSIPSKFNLHFFYDFYKKWDKTNAFFSSPRWFHLLSGNTQLIKQIREGQDIETIRRSWQPALDQYKALRKRYLLYPDF